MRKFLILFILSCILLVPTASAYRVETIEYSGPFIQSMEKGNATEDYFKF